MLICMPIFAWRQIRFQICMFFSVSTRKLFILYHFLLENLAADSSNLIYQGAQTIILNYTQLINFKWGF